MCGIAGIFVRSEAAFRPGEVAAGMAARLVHRGPDDAGLWIDETAGVALAHRRLSIIDTSSGGHQPMASPSGRYTIAYNGEIYNFYEIRQDLIGAGATFRTQSDTEVLLAAIETWGLTAALARVVGMYAFALWDARARQLSLVRDRAGEKPLYWGLIGGNLAFASELKAFRAVPGFDGNVDRAALSLYARFAYVPAPYSIYSSIRKLPPGHIACIGSDLTGRLVVETQAYWRASDAIVEQHIGYDEARRKAEALLSQAVRGQMISDVPLGAFLSGGIDSTAIVALMQEASSRPVRTFSIGSTESAYDEAPFAAAVARHLGTDHTELRVSPAEALAIVPELPAIYDEPFADSSQIPTVLVARMARRHVTVALSGDAGDEVFGGYNRYIFAPKVWAKAGRWPHFARAAAAAAIVAVPPSGWDRIAGLVTRSMGQGSVRLLGEKLHKLARALPAANRRELYERLASCWIESPLLDGPQESQQQWYSVPEQVEASDRFVDLMMYLDFVTYLPDDILVKVDRACMSTSLESRVPMLDHRLVEFMGRLPAGHKVSATGSKPILRDIAYSRVPRELLERPKMGFGVPIDVWLRGPLRDWAEDLLSPSRITSDGFFNTRAIREAWQQHLSGRRVRHHELWTVLMFQAWLEREHSA